MESYERFVSELRDYISDAPHLSIAELRETYRDGERRVAIELTNTNTVIEAITPWVGDDDDDYLDEVGVTNRHDDPHCADRAAALDEFDRWMVEEAGIVSASAAQRMEEVEFADGYGRMSAEYRASVGF